MKAVEYAKSSEMMLDSIPSRPYIGWLSEFCAFDLIGREFMPAVE